MVWFLPALEGRDNCLPLVTAFSFLTAKVLSAVMGCFFSCFRRGSSDDPPTDDRSRYQLVPPTEAAVGCNWSPFASLFFSDDKEDQYGLEAKGVEKQDIGTPELELDVTKLKHQAKFLKACGTIPEAPVEIQNLSEECGDSSVQKVVLEPPKFNSWLPDSSVENQDLVAQPDQPMTPFKNCEELMEGSVSSDLSPSSHMNDGEKSISCSSIHGSVSSNTPRFTEINANQAHSSPISSLSHAIPPSSTHINKSVRFEFDPDSSMAAKKFSSNFASLKSQLSPYPTPLKLTDDMQTPGTIFPAYVNGKNPRVRYQYVSSTLNLVGNVSQLKELMDERSISNQDSASILLPTVEQPNEANLNSESEMVLRETTAKKELKLEASLSSRLKPPLNQEDSNLHIDESVHYGRTPSERPILGLVADHWYDHDASHVSPKWWNGNGIPNTITKYKEDQKVNWHATPFEERLEKALSDERFVSRRKQMASNFSENEGSFAV